MNKCSKCGAEFEGNFCPECGTPSTASKVCPKCGATLDANVKFCNSCGYSFYEQAPTQPAPAAEQAPAQAPAEQPAPVKEKQPFDWKNNKIIRNILLYAPLAIFALWAVLMFAFMAAPVMKDLVKVSVYGFFNSDNLLDDDMAAIVPAAGALLAFSLISLLYAGWLAFLQFKGDRVPRWLSHYASALLYVIALICTSVIAVKVNKYVDGMNDMKGSFVGVTVAFTVIFLLLHAAALVGCKLLHIEDITPDDRAKAKQNFDEWVARCREQRAKRREARRQLHEYKAERKAHIKERIKTEPYMRGRSTGAMCIAVLLCIVIGAAIGMPMYVKYFVSRVNFDAYYKYKRMEVIEDQFDYLEHFYEGHNDGETMERHGLYEKTSEFYERVLSYHYRYEQDMETYEGEQPTFDQWCKEREYELSYSERHDYDYLLNDIPEIVPSQLYELGVDGCLAARFPNGLSDFIKDAMGVAVDNIDDLREQYKDTYDYKEMLAYWENGDSDLALEHTEAIVCLSVMSGLVLLSILFGLFGCIAAFRKKRRKAVAMSWLFNVFCCLLFIASVMCFLTGVEEIVDTGDDASFGRFMGFYFGSFSLMVMLSFVEIIVLYVAEKNEARKRFRIEYDQEQAEQGNEVAIRLTERKKRAKHHPDDSDDSDSSSYYDEEN